MQPSAICDAPSIHWRWSIYQCGSGALPEVEISSLPLATRDLRIASSSLGARAGVVGAAFMVLDELFAPDRLSRWLDLGSPAGHPQLAEAVA